MKKIPNISPANALFIFLSFWMTVLLVRGIIFLYVRQGIFPAVFVRGFHIHHFITGFLFLLLALLLASHLKHRKYIPATLCGVGLALVFDEMLFWTRGHFDYWNIINLAGTAVVGTLLAAWYEHSRTQSWRPLLPFRPYLFRWVVVFVPVFLALVLLFNFFSYYSTTAAKAKNYFFPIEQELQIDE